LAEKKFMANSSDTYLIQFFLTETPYSSALSNKAIF